MNKGVDASFGGIHSQYERKQRDLRELERFAQTSKRIFDFFKPYTPTTVLNSARQSLKGEQTNPLWVESIHDPLPNFPIHDLIEVLRPVVLSLNGLTRSNRDVHQSHKAAELIVREQLVHLMLPKAERAHHSRQMERLWAFVDQESSGEKKDAEYLDEDMIFGELQIISTELDSAQAWKIKREHTAYPQDPVVLETKLFAMPVTGSHLEYFAHNMSKLCREPIQSFTRWEQLPKLVRTRLLESNSLAAFILLLRFMGFRQDQLIGIESANSTHRDFQKSILNNPQISQTYGEFTEARIGTISAFVRRIYNYSDEHLWKDAGRGRMYPIIGWKSLAGLAQSDILAFAGDLDGADLLVPDKADDETVTVVANNQQTTEWLQPHQYQRLVRYQVGYATLYACLLADKESWPDAFEDELWLRHVVGNKWTNQLLWRHLDLFPLDSIQKGSD